VFVCVILTREDSIFLNTDSIMRCTGSNSYSAIFNYATIHDNADISVDESQTIPKNAGCRSKCGEAKPSVLSGDKALALSSRLEPHLLLMIYVWNDGNC